MTLSAIAVLAYFLVIRPTAARPVSTAALATARNAGCGGVQTPAAGAPGGLHLQPGQAYSYPQHPATSGYHDPVPLPPDPHVYARPVPETRAVHNLEHAYVLIYYRASGAGALPEADVRELQGIAGGERRVIMAPYTELPAGTALALAAWNKLWECPPTVTPGQAGSITHAFIDAYRGTSNAPEPPRGLLGPWIFP